MTEPRRALSRAAASRFAALVGVDAPIVLAPFGGLSSTGLTALVCEAGGLGSYGLYGYSASRIREAIAGIRAATDRPFAVNLWLPTGDEREPTRAEFSAAADVVAGFFEEVGLQTPTPPERYLPAFDEQIDAVLDERPAAISFVYGVPQADIVSRARERGIVVIGTATTVDEAVALENGGVDAIVAMSAEAAGHRVSFLASAAQSLVGAMALIPQVVDAVDVPVIAAGGISDRRGVSAAFALGAHAVQIGTAFLRTGQSAANRAHREAITRTAAHGTVLTTAMSGRLARGAPNRAIRHIEDSEAIAPFPAQNWLTGRFRAAAALQDRGDLQSLWLGQGAPLAREPDAHRVFAELCAGLPH